MKTKKVLKCIDEKHGIFKRLNIENETFKNLGINNLIVKKSSFYNCIFKKLNINLDIKKTNFSMCEFTDIKFEGIVDELISSTAVSKVHFYGCSFKNVNFDCFDVDDQVTFDDCNGIYLFNRNGGRFCIAVEFDDCLMIKAGCFWGTLAEFKELSIAKYIEIKMDINPYKHQIKYLENIEKDLYKKEKVEKKIELKA